MLTHPTEQRMAEVKPFLATALTVSNGTLQTHAKSIFPKIDVVCKNA